MSLTLQHTLPNLWRHWRYEIRRALTKERQKPQTCVTELVLLELTGQWVGCKPSTNQDALLTRLCAEHTWHTPLCTDTTRSTPTTYSAPEFGLLAARSWLETRVTLELPAVCTWHTPLVQAENYLWQQLSNSHAWKQEQNDRWNQWRRDCWQLGRTRGSVPKLYQEGMSALQRSPTWGKRVPKLMLWIARSWRNASSGPIDGRGWWRAQRSLIVLAPSFALLQELPWTRREKRRWWRWLQLVVALRQYLDDGYDGDQSLSLSSLRRFARWERRLHHIPGILSQAWADAQTDSDLQRFIHS